METDILTIQEDAKKWQRQFKQQEADFNYNQALYDVMLDLQDRRQRSAISMDETTAMALTNYLTLKLR